MRSWNMRERLSALVVLGLIVIAGCTIEVNINTNDEAESTSPIVTVGPNAPPTAPVPPAPPEAPRLDLTPPPPVPGILLPPPEADPPVRDALFRFNEDRRPAEQTPLTIEELIREPAFTPFTVAPSILNRTEVIDAMQRAYPPLLRDAGIGGTARIYFLIGDDGTVESFRLDDSSGHEALDDAALRVASVYRFSPAMNRNEPVPVWASFPITFQVR